MTEKIAKRQPWLKFYTSDWRGDAALRGCGYAARGLWIDMLSLMHEGEPYGHLVVNGRTIEVKQLAGIFGGTAAEVGKLLAELEAAGVFSRASEGAIYSRRMVADNRKLERDRNNGKGGGNPNLTSEVKLSVDSGDNGGVNPQGNPAVNGVDKAQIPDTRKKEDTSSLRSLAAEPPVEPTPVDPAKAFFDEAKPALSRLLGKPVAAAAQALGRLRRDYGNDDIRLLEQIRAAEANPPADPMSWLMVRSKQTPRANAPAKSRPPCPEDPPAAWSGMTEIFEPHHRTGVMRPVIAGHYLDLSAQDVANAAGFRWDWRGDWHVLAGWMRDGLHIDEQIIPAIRRVVERPGYQTPATLRYFDQAVRGTR